MKTRLAFIIAISLICLAGCSKEENPVRKIRIAEQYGLAYAPLQVLVEKGFLEEKAGDVEVQWVRLGNTAAIREAVLAGDLDIGFMGIPPFSLPGTRGWSGKSPRACRAAPLGWLFRRGSSLRSPIFPSMQKSLFPSRGAFSIFCFPWHSIVKREIRLLSTEISSP